STYEQWGNQINTDLDYLVKQYNKMRPKSELSVLIEKDLYDFASYVVIALGKFKMLTHSVFEKEPLYVNVPDPSRSEDTASDMNNNIHDNQHANLFEEASIPKDEHSQTLQQINHLQSKLRSTPLKVVDRKGISSKIEKLNEKLNPKFQESVNDQVSSTNAQSCQNQRHKAVSF
ncbi:unnamed protein product, partial [Meganyctiphanes norvegica]